MFKIQSITVILFVLVTGDCLAFTAPRLLLSHAVSAKAAQGYVPDGLTAAEYERIKSDEKSKYKKQNLGRLGPRGFKSRSMEAWQKAYEQGQAGHVFAPVGFREKLQKGLIRRVDVPYMVRGGSWDNSDVNGARRLPWTKEDKAYAKGGYKKEQSASILGSGPGLDWTGSRTRGEGSKTRIPGFS